MKPFKFSKPTKKQTLSFLKKHQTWIIAWIITSILISPYFSIFPLLLYYLLNLLLQKTIKSQPIKQALRGYLILIIFALLPLFPAFLLSPITSIFNCSVNEAIALPCRIIFFDIGDLVHSTLNIAWSSLITIPLAILASFFWSGMLIFKFLIRKHH